MLKTFHVILIVLLFTGKCLFSKDLEITYPLTNQKACNDGSQIRVEWEYTGNDNFNVRVVFRHIPPYYSLTVADSIPVRQGYAVVGMPYYFMDYRPFDLIVKNAQTGEELAVSKSVTVYNRPVINAQSPTGEVCKGYPLKLFVKASGDYQSVSWYRNGQLIEGATDISLDMESLHLDFDATYKCILHSNSTCGDVESKDINIIVGDGPDIVQQPEDIPFVKGRDAHFSVRAHLTPEDEKHVRFQWWRDSIYNYISYVNGKEISRFDSIMVPIYDGNQFAGTRSDYLSVKITSVWDKTNYYCQVITDWGCTFSKPGRVIDWFDVIMLSKDYNGCVDNDIKLEVQVLGYSNDEVTFQWYKTGGKLLPESGKFKGTHTPVLNIIDVQKADMGAYYCRVTHKQTGYWRNSVICAVVPEDKPHIIWQNTKWVIKHPTDTALLDVVNVVILLDNLKPVYYTLFKKGEVIATGFGYGVQYNPFDSAGDRIIATPADTGAYVCKFWNDCGVTWSDTCYVYWDDKDTLKGTIKPAESDSDTLVQNGNYLENRNTEGNLSGNIHDNTNIESYLEVYPNPAPATTVYWYGIGESDEPRLEIYNAYGELISILSTDGLSIRGAVEFHWNGCDAEGNHAPDGVYYARVSSRGGLKAVKIMLMR